MACCIATAHASARLRLVKATISPSPEVLHLRAPGALDGSSQEAEVGLAKGVGRFGTEASTTARWTRPGP